MRRRVWPGAVLVLLLLTACTARTPRPTAVPTAVDAAALPDKTASVLLTPEDGGAVALREGAELALPRQSLSDSTLVTLRALDDVPAPPSPRSLIGRAYDVNLDGGSLIGVGSLTLPLPTGVSAEQYDLAAYHWDGRNWVRVEARSSETGARLGLETPGTYALQGEWRLANATMATTLPPAQPGAPAFPVEVRGQYRYRALPAMQHDYVEAHLALKRDTSGGAGQVGGLDGLDMTVAETVMWFKPDPSQAEGAIDFNYTFQLDPVALNVPLGSVNQFYATLTVSDSAAPTRRMSNAVEYIAQLPIHTEGTDVVRPELPASGNQQALQWHVRLNGRTLLRRPSDTPTLSLAEVLAQGGLGEYRITVEVESEGQYVAVSNEVTVQLALPSTITPTPAAVAAAATPWPFGTMPATPTRRAPPSGVPGSLDYPTPGAASSSDTPTPARTATPAVTPTATRPGGDIFWAEREVLAPGECTTLHWKIENVAAVYVDGNPTTGDNSKQVCPARSETHSLRAETANGRSFNYRVTITVQGPGQPGEVSFSVDRSRIVQGTCATLTWRAVNVKQVYLNGEGQAGEASKEVCPQQTTDYRLRVVDTEDHETTQQITVWVTPEDQILLLFWADQYTLRTGQCTTLHWVVDNVERVTLRSPGRSNEEGVTGHDQREVCLDRGGTYTLSAEVGGRLQRKELALQVGDVGLGREEVIAQGVIVGLTPLDDLDPTTAGRLPGWRIEVEGVTPLLKGRDDCCAGRMTLLVYNPLFAGQYPLQVDWPLHTGQLVEFWLSPCGTSECKVFNVPPRFYIKARSD